MFKKKYKQTFGLIKITKKWANLLFIFLRDFKIREYFKGIFPLPECDVTILILQNRSFSWLLSFFSKREIIVQKEQKNVRSHFALPPAGPPPLTQRVMYYLNDPLLPKCNGMSYVINLFINGMWQ